MNMIAEAKKAHAEKIAKAMGYKVGDKLYRSIVKDLLKLNYTTLVELSPKVKK